MGFFIVYRRRTTREGDFNHVPDILNGLFRYIYRDIYISGYIYFEKNTLAQKWPVSHCYHRILIKKKIRQVF